MVSSDLIKRSLLGTYSALADGSTGNIAINVPIDISNGLGIQIWGLEIEYSDGTWHVVDNKTLAIALCRTLGSAERYVNDPDVIFKMKLHSELATNGAILADQCKQVDMYPAIPFAGPQLHVTITNNTGASQNIYVKVWFSTIRINFRESLGMLQNQIF